MAQLLAVQACEERDLQALRFFISQCEAFSLIVPSQEKQQAMRKEKRLFVHAYALQIHGGRTCVTKTYMHAHARRGMSNEPRLLAILFQAYKTCNNLDYHSQN
jgi:hypothetical protein